MKSKVILLPCDSYDEEQVYQQIKTGMQLLGGFKKYIHTEEKILLKPNLVRKADVERAVITHPVIVGAVARLLREEGCSNISCGDSCGTGDARRVMEGTGMDTVLRKYDIEVEDFGQAEMTDEFFLAKPVIEADALINLCKMKTHALERVTGGVKNLYGCISGFHKAQGHTKYPNAESFARMLINLNLKLQPRLCIMDGIMAMEGNGPTSGDPTAMNLILISDDPVALDSVFCHLVNLDPRLVPTNIHGERMGLGTWKEEEIQIITPQGSISFEDAVKRFGNPDFNVDRKKQRNTIWNKLGFFMKPLGKRPYIVDSECRKCGVCVQACPVEGKALTFANGRKNPPAYDYKKCIRCFCCQEMCPHKAIHVR
jgi:uncharacterized protein (DUF362 family)/Pyruvate/2-oxoacid:ferredoxin oxidoreductase delta subunit